MNAALISCFLGLVLAGPIHADDWPQWLGPNRNGIAPGRGAATLLRQPRPLWTNAVGLGCSSIVVSQGRAYTIGHVKGEGKRGTDTVYCLDANTGAVLWKHAYDCLTLFTQDVRFDGPRSTPTVEGGRVYTLSLEGHLFCFEAATGKVLWSRQLTRDLEGRIPTYGYCCSALVHGNLLLLELNAPKASYAALDKTNGDVAWQLGGGSVTCGSPVLTTIDGGDCAVFMGGGVVMGVQPDTGKELWRHHTWGHAWMGQVVSGDKIFVANASLPRGCGAIRVANGRPRVLWEDRKKFQTLHNNSVVWNGHLYGIDNTGTDLQENDNSRSRLKCLVLDTGEEKWAQERMGWSNLILYDGKLILLRQVGELVIADASPEGFKEFSRATVLEGRSWTVPALANGKLYCRNNQGRVVCLQLQAE